MSLIMLISGDVYDLITYCTVVESFFTTLSAAAVLWLRYKRPELPRPIKVLIFKFSTKIFRFKLSIKRRFISGSFMDTYNFCERVYIVIDRSMYTGAARSRRRCPYHTSRDTHFCYLHKISTPHFG